MNTKYEYSLSKKGKHKCPYCGRKRKFVLYVNNKTGEPLHSTVGRCDGSDKCGMHYPPRQYFADNAISLDSHEEYKPRIKTIPKPVPKPKPSYIDANVYKKCLTGYEDNRFICYLRSIVKDDDTAMKTAGRYFIGTSNEFGGGAAVFPQIDLQGNIRTAKIMQYSASTGKRVKRETRNGKVPLINWVHNILNLPDFNLSQCFFGEHLLSERYKTVAVVESEKTAVIASVYFPDMIWLACGGKHGLNTDKCHCLKGRNVILFPDAKAFDDWNKKAKELSTICSVSVFSMIEEHATDTEQDAGLDLADYLVRYMPSEFVRQPVPQKLAEMSEICPSKTETDTVPDNPVVNALCAKNKALLNLMKTFDCEVTSTGRYEPTRDELKQKLPDNDSWTEAELCRMLNINPAVVVRLAKDKMIYFISISGKYCRTGCTPF